MKSSSFKAPKILKGKGRRQTGGQDNFDRAKSRTLQMTVVVVLSFLLAWTPYTIAMFVHFLRASAHHRPISPLVSKLLYAFAVFNSAASPYLCVYSYFSFQQIRVELRSLLCCKPAASITNARTSSLAERRRAIRQRPSDSHTCNSLSAFSPNTTTSLNMSRRISTATDSRTARVRRLGASPQACSFDEASGHHTHSRRPSQLRILSTITDVSQSPVEFDGQPGGSRKVSTAGLSTTAHSSPTISVHRAEFTTNDAV
ncbi:Gonadotropin-releasing hormone II receptor [Aphelenchoides fujianensis]|nr:Gonadotropin-releasing hormone II receptor [Aphelenchoides fujianensis]